MTHFVGLSQILLPWQRGSIRGKYEWHR